VDNLTAHLSGDPAAGWLPIGAGIGSVASFGNLSCYGNIVGSPQTEYEILGKDGYVVQVFADVPDIVNAYLRCRPEQTTPLIWNSVADESDPPISGLRQATNFADEPKMNQPADAWLPRAFDRLQELMLLPSGWDGEGGRSITPAVASAAFNMLDRLASRASLEPSLVPTREGRLQLEWHEPTGHLEAEINPDGSAVHVWYHDLLSDTERDETIPSMGRAVAEIDALVAVLDSRS